MKYVDGYVLPVPKKNLAAYRQMAAKAAKIWRKYGALEFRECVGDDLKTIKVRSFPGPSYSHGSFTSRARTATA